MEHSVFEDILRRGESTTIEFRRCGIVYASFKAVHSLGRRHPNAQDPLSSVLYLLELQARRHVEQVGVACAVDEIALYLK